MELVDEKILECRRAERLAVTCKDGRIDDVALGCDCGTLALLRPGVGAVPGSDLRSRARAGRPPVKSPKTCTREALGAQKRNRAVQSGYRRLPIPSLLGEGARIGDLPGGSLQSTGKEGQGACGSASHFNSLPVSWNLVPRIYCAVDCSLAKGSRLDLL